MSKPRTAFVTGAAQGIGLAVARHLGESGCRVICIDRNAESLKMSVSQLQGIGIEAVAFDADVLDRERISSAIAAEEVVDIVVTAAGLYWDRAFDDLVEDDFRRMMDVNLIGTFIIAQEAARKMKEGGRIITISSRGALGGTRFAHYVASKAAVVGLTRAMAMELRARQITVNSVAPYAPSLSH